jgi:glycerol-3-phosphate dehydrogenase subunit C
MSSTSCGLTLKSKYATYLGMADRDAARVASSVADICEFLMGRSLDIVLSDLKRMKARVYYHPPCQLRGHAIGFPALELLHAVPGLEVIVSDQSCCGIGGTYGYDKQRNPISMAIGAPLKNRIAELSPDMIACDSETCRWHLEAMTGIRAVHPIQVIAMALDGTLSADSGETQHGRHILPTESDDQAHPVTA